ncbi:HAAS signaling domain-containing protein [Streptomyces sp. NPDC019443]|uniref:HAAS signaling domain-containing protein n=1 Tax=Streptomyces sp. NPDC019443 TaxID=3365061 RepID=UPI00379F643C
MTSSQSQLIDEYLRRFDNAAVFLATDRRKELRQEIVEHIDAGMEEADALHAEAVRAVLERLGPPADIVAAELGGPRSTGSTPVVKPTAPAADAAHKQEIDREGQLPQARDDGAAPLASSPPSRRRMMLLIGTAATALVASVLAFGISTRYDDPGRPPALEKPAITPSNSEGPGSTSTSGLPTADRAEPTASPSDGPSEAPDDPTASPS